MIVDAILRMSPGEKRQAKGLSQNEYSGSGAASQSEGL